MSVSTEYSYSHILTRNSMLHRHKRKKKPTKERKHSTLLLISNVTNTTPSLPLSTEETQISCRIDQHHASPSSVDRGNTDQLQDCLSSLPRFWSLPPFQQQCDQHHASPSSVDRGNTDQLQDCLSSLPRFWSLPPFQQQCDQHHASPSSVDRGNTDQLQDCLSSLPRCWKLTTLSSLMTNVCLWLWIIADTHEPRFLGRSIIMPGSY